MSINPIIRKWANVFLKLDRMVEGSPNTKTAGNKIMRALQASTPDARSVAGWYSAYRAGRVSLDDAAWALHREGAALPSRQVSAAYPHEGSAQIKIRGAGFVLYYWQTANPLGLAAEKMPEKAGRVRESLEKFVKRLSEGMGLDMTVDNMSRFVLFGVEGSSITFNVDANVTATTGGRPFKNLTKDLIMAQEKAVFSRFGYHVSVI